MKRILGMVLLLLLACVMSAGAEVAADLTHQSLINDKPYNARRPDTCRDNNHETYTTRRTMTITAPAGQTIGSLQLKWRTIVPPTIRVEAYQNGGWVEVYRETPEFAAQYIVLPGEYSEVRVSAVDAQLELTEVTVLGPGEAPGHVQIWRHPPEKVDLMLLSTHPDDEVLWFGGMLPLYAGEQGKDVLVVNAVYGWYCRRLELLDCLWTCGVDIYPVMLRYPDKDGPLEEVYQQWSQRDGSPKDKMVEVIRRYKPDVVVLHDVHGEYGHPAHILYSKIGCQGVTRAANPEEHWQSAQQWGVWDVPKTYVHLWDQNEIVMDWKVPLEAFDGMTGLDVARLGMQCHRSQLGRGWKVSDGGSYDNRCFGLWRTNVGYDVLKNDLFENIPEKAVQADLVE